MSTLTMSLAGVKGSNLILDLSMLISRIRYLFDAGNQLITSDVIAELL